MREHFILNTGTGWEGNRSCSSGTGIFLWEMDRTGMKRHLLCYPLTWRLKTLLLFNWLLLQREAEHWQESANCPFPHPWTHTWPRVATVPRIGRNPISPTQRARLSLLSWTLIDVCGIYPDSKGGMIFCGATQETWFSDFSHVISGRVDAYATMYRRIHCGHRFNVAIWLPFKQSCALLIPSPL